MITQGPRRKLERTASKVDRQFSNNNLTADNVASNSVAALSGSTCVSISACEAASDAEQAVGQDFKKPFTHLPSHPEQPPPVPPPASTPPASPSASPLASPA